VPQPKLRKPTRAELEAARNGRVPDVIASGLRVLLVGINPGLYSAAVRHHFARPGNRFWPALALSGLTPRQFAPDEERELLALGIGITNLVARATATADELDDDELQRGARRLAAKVRRFEPRTVAIVGLTAYRTAFRKPHATLGRQPEGIGDSVLWVLPNPSGLNAHHQLPALARLFAELR
jgi:TDG/mug DNA glycosylase family protein